MNPMHAGHAQRDKQKAEQNNAAPGQTPGRATAKTPKQSFVAAN
jgi:hypothetical protein